MAGQSSDKGGETGNKEKKSRRISRGKRSVYQRADSRWVAQDALRKALNEQERGVLTTGPQQTLKTYLTHWLEEVHKPTIRLSTYIKYRKLINNYILPVLGHVRLQKLSPQQVLSLYRQKEKE